MRQLIVTGRPIAAPRAKGGPRCGDARETAAVLALGTQAAWLDTRFLLAEEMSIHEEYRRLLIAATETDAEWYPNRVGWPDAPHRALHNSTAEMWEAAGRPAPGSRPGDGQVIGALRFGRADRSIFPGAPDAWNDRRDRGAIAVDRTKRFAPQTVTACRRRSWPSSSRARNASAVCGRRDQAKTREATGAMCYPATR